jgi:hypothetical protein
VNPQRAAGRHVSAPQHAAIPHVNPQQRAAGPHVTSHREAEHHVTQPNASAATSAAAPARSSPAAAAVSTAAQKRADRAERRHERSVLRSLPASQRAARREEFRQQREQRQNAQTNTSTRQNAAVQSNAATRSNALARRRNARRNGNAAITAQAAQQGRFASRFASRRQGANAGARFVSDPAAARRAWHRHRRAAFVAWYGPVFWPYAYSDIFDYAFWPNGYDEGYWDYAYDDFVDGMFWGEAGPPSEYAYAEPADRSTTRVSEAGVEELCTQPGSGITAWPFADIERKVGLNAEQKKQLQQMRAAATKAGAVFKASCPAENAFPLTPPGRLTAMTARLDATLQAVNAVKPALDAFYNSLSDEQKERFNELGPSTQVARAGAETTGSTTQAADTCKQPKPGLANLPIDKIEDVIKPNDAQDAKLDTLQTATDKGVSMLQAACPDETPLTPTGRLDAMQKRLQAMVDAANEVKPALTDFYSSLDGEQKARFNRIGQELAKSNG